MDMVYFENEMKNYVRKQFQLLDVEHESYIYKKSKFLLESNESELKPNKCLNDGKSLTLLEQSVISYFNDIVKQSQTDVDSIGTRSSRGGLIACYPHMSSIIKRLNEQENNNLHLNETNRKKMMDYCHKLTENTSLSSLFPSEQNIDQVKSSPEIINGLPKAIVIDPSNHPEEEVIRCICGILKDEGNMIQCDQCQVWQHLECVQQFNKITEDDYHCEKCHPREVPLVS